MQIQREINFIFIETQEDLLSEMKTIVKYFSFKKPQAPKTKTFTAAQKTNHLQNLIQNIPGIGKNVSKSLASYFGSINNMWMFIKDDEEDRMKEFVVWDDEKKNSRTLGEKQAEIIKFVFTGSNTSDFRK